MNLMLGLIKKIKIIKSRKSTIELIGIKRYLTGLAKYNLGDNQAAIVEYNHAIKIHRKFALAYFNRGLVKYDLGQYQKAMTDYDTAIIMNPNYPMAYFKRGILKAELGQKAATGSTVEVFSDPRRHRAELTECRTTRAADV